MIFKDIISGTDFFNLVRYYKTHINTEYDNFPKEPAVYFLFDKYGRLIYIGETENIHNRTKYHFSKSETNLTIKNEVCFIYYVLTKTKINSKIIEASLLYDYECIYNHKPRANNIRELKPLQRIKRIDLYERKIA